MGSIYGRQTFGSIRGKTTRTQVRINLIYKAVCCFIALVGGRNWYEGVDEPTLWQRLYKWRVSPKTAWTLTRRIWFGGMKKEIISPALPYDVVLIDEGRYHGYGDPWEHRWYYYGNRARCVACGKAFEKRYH